MLFIVYLVDMYWVFFFILIENGKKNNKKLLILRGEIKENIV